MQAIRYSFLAICLMLSGAFLHASVFAQDIELQQISRFSKKPLPRFESLRYSAVHGRKGPTLDHPILWRYERKGLPVLVLRETHGWRRVRDADGDEVWLQARMLSEERTALVVQDEILYQRSDDHSTQIAKVMPGLVASLIGCEADWCRIEVHKRVGWVRRQALWGTLKGTGPV